MPPVAAALPDGYSAVAPGRIATIVTCLEMRARPALRAARPFPPGCVLQPLDRSDPEIYLSLYRAVGSAWLWFSRLAMPQAELRAILADPAIDILALRSAGRAIGLLELDFRQQGSCELIYFGLVPEAVGKGLGRTLMNAAIDRAWSRPIERFWVHTCTLDHPAAVDFYRRSGFRPYALQVEVMADPRLTGLLSRDCAPHVPLIEPGAPG